MTRPDSGTDLGAALGAALRAARPDAGAVAGFVKSHVHAQLVGRLTQGGIAVASVVFTLIASVLRNRPLTLLHGLTLLMMLVILMRAVTPRSLGAERFFMLCYMFLIYMLLRAITYLFHLNVAYPGAFLYDVAATATALASVGSARAEGVAAVTFYALFLIPRPGVSPYLEPVLVSTARTAVLFGLFFALQFAQRSGVVRHPDAPQIDDALSVPRYGYVLLVHPAAWLAAPLVLGLAAATLEHPEPRADTPPPEDDVEAAVARAQPPTPAQLLPPSLPPSALTYGGPPPAPRFVGAQLPGVLAAPPEPPRFAMVGVSELPPGVMAPAPYLPPAEPMTAEERQWLASKGIDHAKIASTRRTV